MTEFQVLRAEKWFDRVVFMLDLSNWRFSEYAAIGVFIDGVVHSVKKSQCCCMTTLRFWP
jgi:hypothetical protein